MESRNYKTIVKAIGLLLTLLSIYYIGLSFSQHSNTLFEVIQKPFFYLLFLIGLVLYGITMLIIVKSWQLQLIDKYPHIKSLALYRILGISQIGKYLPGNIAHIGSRFYLAKNLGIKVRDITNSFIYETFLVIFSALLVSSIYFYYYSIPIINIEINFKWLILIIAISIVVFYFAFVKYRDKQLLSFQKFTAITALFIISHILLGFIVYLLHKYMFFGQSSWVILTSIIAISFVAGYVSPGSPGGIGIREFVFLKLAIVIMDESIALTIIVTLRLITVFGDILMYLVALKVKK